MSDNSSASLAGGQTNKLIYFFGALGGLLFGYDTGIISGTILFINMTLAPNVPVLVLFRVVLGLAVGAASLIVPRYLAEMAPTRIRGALSSLNQLMIVTGILVAYIAVGPTPVFLGYAVLGVLAFLFTSAPVTEPKGRSLERIEADLRGRAVV